MTPGDRITGVLSTGRVYHGEVASVSAPYGLLDVREAPDVFVTERLCDENRTWRRGHHDVRSPEVAVLRPDIPHVYKEP